MGMHMLEEARKLQVRADRMVALYEWGTFFHICVFVQRICQEIETIVSS